MIIKEYCVPHKYRNKFGQARTFSSGSSSGYSSGTSTSSGNSTTINEEYVTKTVFNNRLQVIENQLKDDIEEIINNMDNGHVLLTESEYNNLPEKDEKTVYMIKGSHFILLTNEEYTNLRQKDESKIYLITT